MVQAIMQDIVQGSLQNPPRQYTITIAPGEVLPFYYSFDFFRILTLSSTDVANLTIRFGKSGLESNVIGAGVGYKLPYVTESLTFTNIGATPITFTFILAIGQIFDDRLTVSGTLDVNSKNVANNQIISLPDVSIPATSTAVVLNTIVSVQEIIISNPATNTATFRIGGSSTTSNQGAMLPPGATIVLSTLATIYAYNPDASAQSLCLTTIRRV